MFRGGGLADRERNKEGLNQAGLKKKTPNAGGSL